MLVFVKVSTIADVFVVANEKLLTEALKVAMNSRMFFPWTEIEVPPARLLPDALIPVLKDVASANA